MFWAITCEAGKRYSQVPADPYHVSMAALEPREQIPPNTQVSLMLEHRGKEFLLCTLEYNKVMQINLDLKFGIGEENVFFVNGDGTIHLSGYLLYPETITGSALEKADQEILEDVSTSEGEEEEEEDDDEQDEVEGTERLLMMDESDASSSEDWEPEIVKQSKKKQKHVNFRDNIEDSFILPTVETVDEEEEEEEEEESVQEESSEYEDNDIKEITHQKKRRQPQNSMKEAKRCKKTDNDMQLKVEYIKVAKKKKKPKNCITVDDDDNDSIKVESSDNEMNSSVGRTPMPSKKLAFLKGSKSAPPKSILSSPSLMLITKTRRAVMSETKSPSILKERTVQKPTPQCYSVELPSGLKYEDIKIGSGPIAKSGKKAHINFVGRLKDNTVFDANNSKNKPFSFTLGNAEVIKGLDIGVEGMRVGGKRVIKVPPWLGYGKKDQGPIPSNSALHFNVELNKVS